MIHTSAGAPGMDLMVYIDGKFLPQSEAKVSVFDHGLLYGDGVFEGIRAYNGRVFKLDRHMDRLFQSAKAIDLKIPHTKEEIARIILETCRRNDIKEGYIRPIITRGPGDLGLDPRKCKSGPTLIVIAQPSINLLGKVYDRGLKVVTSSYRRVPPQSLSPSIKSLNYLNNIMAKVEANQYGADEALMLDIHGYVSEASAENIFLVRNHTLVTPFTSTNLPGVTRETVLELAPTLGLEAKEQFFTLYDVWSADEAFITGSAAEVAPVVEVDGRTIGDGKPGPTTKAIMKAFRDLVMSSGTPI
jgi:branched-chain amino acid aminotransferase